MCMPIFPTTQEEPLALPSFKPQNQGYNSKQNIQAIEATGSALDLFQP